MQRDTFIQALRDVADWFEATPCAPVPDGLDIAVYDTDVVALADIARTDGVFDKRYFGSLFELSRTFADESYERVKVAFNSSRDKVCTKRVVGTKMVTVPAVEAAPEREVEQEIVEWDCIPLLAASKVS